VDLGTMIKGWLASYLLYIVLVNFQIRPLHAVQTWNWIASFFTFISLTITKQIKLRGTARQRVHKVLRTLRPGKIRTHDLLWPMYRAPGHRECFLLWRKAESVRLKQFFSCQYCKIGRGHVQGCQIFLGNTYQIGKYKPINQQHSKCP
jgi:hypothetical protein